MNGSVPQRVEMDTVRGSLKAVLATNSTDSAFDAARTIQAAEPASSSGAGVVAGQRNLYEVLPFGNGSDDNTVSLRVIGWSKVVDANGNHVGWCPSHICSVQATLTDQITGAAGVTPNGTSDLLPKLITITDGDTSAVRVKPGVTDRTPAWLLIDGLGFDRIEFEPITDGSATGANALIRAL